MELLLAALLTLGNLGATPSFGASSSLPLSIPFEFQNNQIYLRVGINGHPGWFVLDSGASGCVIDTSVAKRLGLATHGGRQITGAGKGTIETTYADNVIYGIAGVDLMVAQSYVIDLSGQPAIVGREIAGILGYDFFARYVVSIDYDAAVVTLSDPPTFSYTGTGTVVPFTLTKKTPHVTVHVTVDTDPGLDREVLVDTGSEDALDDDVLAKAPKRLEIVGGVGLGREFRTTIGRAREMKIGPYTLERPLGATGGVPLIGTEILRRFRVAFDYARTRLILEPNRHFRDAFSFDASGIDLRWSAASFLIHDVASASPAADAGLHAGDAIVSIDRQPAAAFRLDQLQALLTEVGRNVRLGIRRGDRQLEISVRLRERL